MRPLLKTLAALSAFLCLATLITWPLSSSRIPDPTPIRRTLQIEPTSHGLRLIHAARNHPKSFTWFIGGNLMEPDGKHRKITPEGDLHGFPDGSARTVPTQPATFAGLRWEHGAATDGPKSIDDDFKLWLIPWRALTIPYPALALLTATPPSLYLLLAIRSKRRTSRGLCPTCAYDLRASIDRCPECGTPFPSWNPEPRILNPPKPANPAQQIASSHNDFRCAALQK